MLMNFDPIWENIVACKGQTFATKTGQPFAYDIQDTKPSTPDNPQADECGAPEPALQIRRRDLKISKQEIESVYLSRSYIKKENGRGTTALIYALLRDNRVNASRR